MTHSCIQAGGLFNYINGGGVASGMPTSKQREVSAPSWRDLPPLLFPTGRASARMFERVNDRTVEDLT